MSPRRKGFHTMTALRQPIYRKRENCGRKTSELWRCMCLGLVSSQIRHRMKLHGTPGACKFSIGRLCGKQLRQWHLSLHQQSCMQHLYGVWKASPINRQEHICRMQKVEAMTYGVLQLLGRMNQQGTRMPQPVRFKDIRMGMPGYVAVISNPATKHI